MHATTVPRVERFANSLGEGEMAFGEPDSALREYVTRYLGYTERTSFHRDARRCPRCCR
jgi:hypothetical protein